MKKIILAILLVCGICSTVVLPASVAADTSIPYDFTFQPTTLVVDARQGDAFKKDIFILNRSKVNNLSVRLYIENFKAEDGGNTVSFYTTTGNQTNIASWVTPEISTLTLKPEEQQYETLDFSIPDFVKPGTYSGIIFIEQNITNTTQGNGAKVIARAGINLLLNIYKDDAQYSSLYKGTTIEGLHVGLINSQDVHVSGKITNSGVFAVSNTVTMTVTTIFGQKAGTYEYTSIDVLPGGYRYLDGKNKDVVLTGLKPGIYKIDIALKDNLRGSTKFYDSYFTILPIYITIILLITVVILLILTAYAIHRKTVRKS